MRNAATTAPRSPIHRLTSLALTALAATAGNSQAEEAAPADDQLAEVVVTATRREALIQDVPVSITAVSGDELKSRVALNLTDFMQSVPGVQLVNRGPNATEITIRGIASSGTLVPSYQKTTVGYYLNDMPLSENPQAAADIALFDLQRVEILRGPQGTLFGEGAPGGVVRTLVNMPNLDKFEAGASGQTFSYSGGDDSYNVNALVNLPVAPGKFALRLVGGYREDGGFIDDLVGPTLTEVVKDANSSHTSNVRILGKWQASEHLDASFSFIRSRTVRDESNSGVRINGVKRAGLMNEGSGEYNVSNITLNYQLPSATLTSSTNYLDIDSVVFFALPAGGGFVQTQLDHTTVKSWVQELRLVSNGTGPFRWVTGAFYKHQKRETGLPLDVYDSSTEPPTLVFPLFTIFNRRQFDQYAVYGEVEYDFSDRMTLVAGARETREKLDYTTEQHDLAGFFFPDPDTIDSGRETYNAFSPKVSLLFKLDEDRTLYATVAKGFRGPGVKNFYTGGSSTFGAETVLSYEAGFKAFMLDKRIFFTAAAYYNDWRDIQVPLNFGAPWMSEITNAGKAKTRGIEFELRAKIGSAWQLGGTAAFADSELQRYAVSPDLEGNDLGNAPKFSGSFFVDGHWALSNQLGLGARADYTYTGSRYDDIFNSAPKLESYGNLNARIGVDAQNWGVYLFGHNLTDKFAVYTGNTGSGFSVLAPRAVGVGFDVRF